MMRVDFSETLRRGDAYVRVNKSAVKMGRRQLQALFEKKFKDSVSASNIEIGFPGEIIHKDRSLPTCSLAELPSIVASSKLNELIEAKEQVHESASNTMVARLTHARLFGSDTPYEERSMEEIMEEMKQLKKQYRDNDDYFLFEENRNDLQLVVFNQGEEPIRGASLTLVLPNHDVFHIATQLPKLPKGRNFVERLPAEQADYPAVSLRDDSIHVSVKLGDIEPGEPTDVFFTPLRVCVGDEFKGRRPGALRGVPAAAIPVRLRQADGRPAGFQSGRGSAGAAPARSAAGEPPDLLRNDLSRPGRGQGRGHVMAPEHHERCLVRRQFRPVPASGERAPAGGGGGPATGARRQLRNLRGDRRLRPGGREIGTQSHRCPGPAVAACRRDENDL